MPNFNIAKIVDYLGKYKDRLEELYNWEFNAQELAKFGVVRDTELAELQSAALSHFRKTERLKGILSDALNDYPIDSQQFKQIALWIVHRWGRIPKAPENDTMKCILDFLLDEKPPFHRIASSSKVGAFMAPDERIIYDSRVAYTMNWIILSEDAGNRFFPIPPGRNTKMLAFDLDVLIRLKFSHLYRPDNSKNWSIGKHVSNIDSEIYVAKADAYCEMNRLIGEVNRVLWDGARGLEPFYTEMLLFSIADNGVFREITERVRLDIN